MKKYLMRDLIHKRSELWKEARENGVIIQECNTNGEVRCEYVLMAKDNVCMHITKGELIIESKGDL